VDMGFSPSSFEEITASERMVKGGRGVPFISPIFLEIIMLEISDASLTLPNSFLCFL
jgi:hypothetical protein